MSLLLLLLGISAGLALVRGAHADKTNTKLTITNAKIFFIVPLVSWMLVIEYK